MKASVKSFRESFRERKKIYVRESFRESFRESKFDSTKAFTFTEASVEENLLPRKLRRRQFISTKAAVKAFLKASVEANFRQ